MGSSKSANALMARFNYEERGQKALMVKPRLDARDGGPQDHLLPLLEDLAVFVKAGVEGGFFAAPADGTRCRR